MRAALSSAEVEPALLFDSLMGVLIDPELSNTTAVLPSLANSDRLGMASSYAVFKALIIFLTALPSRVVSLISTSSAKSIW